MPIFSQIERLDFTGKNVFALMTHEGSGLGSSERDLKKYCKGAKFGQGLAIHGTGAAGSSSKIAVWAKKNLV